MALRPCPSCARHVRISEATCPFCAVTLGVYEAPPVREPVRPTSRAALVFFGAAATVATVASCTSEPEVVALYGVPPVDAAQTRDAANASDASDAGDATDALDDEQPVPMYGPAVIDASDDG